MLGVRRGMAADELQGATGLYRENRAGIPARDWMTVSVGRRRVEEEYVVGIGEQRFAVVRPTKHAPANEHDAVSGVRLLGALGCDVRVGLEIDDSDAERFKKHSSGVER
jgi:hypothetical protein